MEKDDEVKGRGRSYDFGARMYDPETGRFLSLDPKMFEYPWNSPFNYAENQPIWATDYLGEGKVVTIASPYISRRMRPLIKLLSIGKLPVMRMYLGMIANAKPGYTKEEAAWAYKQFSNHNWTRDMLLLDNKPYEISEDDSFSGYKFRVLDADGNYLDVMFELSEDMENKIHEKLTEYIQYGYEKHRNPSDFEKWLIENADQGVIGEFGDAFGDNWGSAEEQHTVEGADNGDPNVFHRSGVDYKKVPGDSGKYRNADGSWSIGVKLKPGGGTSPIDSRPVRDKADSVKYDIK